MGNKLAEILVVSGAGFRAEKRSAQASAHPLPQALLTPGSKRAFLCVDCVCLLLEF